MIVGILLLLVDRAVPLPRWVAVTVQTIAAASLWIYLTQWQVYPELEDAGHPYAAVLAALLDGVVVKALVDRVKPRVCPRVIPRVLGRWRRRSTRRSAATTTRGPAPARRAAAG